MMDKIFNCLKESDQVLIASHADPDGDAIGSLIAMGLALDELGITATLYNESRIPAVYRFLPSVTKIKRNLDDIRRYDSVILLDCSELERVGNLAGEIKLISSIINIDHHVTNSGYGKFPLIDIKACATAEVVYRLVKYMDAPISWGMATAIYTAILTDTGSFRFSNTTRTSFEICDEMIGLGVDPYTVAQHVYGKYSLGRIKLLLLALDSIEISQNGKVSLMTLTREMLDETGTRTEDIEGLINYARGIEDIKLAALIQETKNGGMKKEEFNDYHVSLRSDGSVDVSEIASDFGGGGHSSAAGFSVKSTLGNLKEKIISLSEFI